MSNSTQLGLQHHKLQILTRKWHNDNQHHFSWELSLFLPFPPPTLRFAHLHGFSSSFAIRMKTAQPLTILVPLWIIIIRLAPWAGKMNQILRCDWLPERARWSSLARSGLPAVSRKKKKKKIFPKAIYIDQACSVKMAGYWPRSYFFCEFMDLDSVSVYKHAKKELGQYPAILTSHLGNNPYILYLSSLPFCAGVQFSRDSIRAYNDWIQIWENRGLWTVYWCSYHILTWWSVIHY